MLCKFCGKNTKGNPGIGQASGLYIFYVCSCGIEWTEGPWSTYEDIERELAFMETSQSKQ